MCNAGFHARTIPQPRGEPALLREGFAVGWYGAYRSYTTYMYHTSHQKRSVTYHCDLALQGGIRVHDKPLHRTRRQRSLRLPDQFIHHGTMNIRESEVAAGAAVSGRRLPPPSVANSN